MEKRFNNKLIEEILSMRLPKTKEFQKCSFIVSDGQFLIMSEHYEAYKFLVVEGLVSCIPDAEYLLSELGWIRFSGIGYVTLPLKKPNKKQLESLELALIEISRYRDSICVQLQSNPRFYSNMQLDDIPYIINQIKYYYETNNFMIKEGV